MTSTQMRADRDALSVADVLDRAADLITPEGAWARHWFAHDATGREVDATDHDACCWCVRGAVFNVCGTDEVDEDKYLAPLRAVLGLELESVEEWNDASYNTQAQVVASLREAAAFAREQGL